MTGRLAEVGKRIAIVQQLGMVVNAMRGIAGTRAQQGRMRLPAIRAYAQTVAQAIAQAQALEPGDLLREGRAKGKPGLIVFGADQGFAGAFTELALEAATPDFQRAHVFLVGNRAITMAAERQLPVGWSIGLPSGATALTDAAIAIADAVYAYLSEAGAVPVAMLYPRWEAGHGAQLVRKNLLPFDPEMVPPRRSGIAPLTNLAAADLLTRLAQEYMFAQICEAAVEAFAAENEARAVTMASARQNIEDKLTALQSEERQTRQGEITAEVIELAAGRTGYCAVDELGELD